ncbi:hypothetical protein ABZT34_29025 [Streptomyces sp. NPDC005329]|uniref:hypothetical protein n=1 Tax=Streptomyces sp. NPDC005329 TaxID=3157034 RepID=UPI00339F43CE
MSEAHAPAPAARGSGPAVARDGPRGCRDDDGFHQGYEPTGRDLHDMELLRGTFGIATHFDP